MIGIAKLNRRNEHNRVVTTCMRHLALTWSDLNGGFATLEKIEHSGCDDKCCSKAKQTMGWQPMNFRPTLICQQVIRCVSLLALLMFSVGAMAIRWSVRNRARWCHNRHLPAEPERLVGNKLMVRAAMLFQLKDANEPTFGAFPKKREILFALEEKPSGPGTSSINL